LDSGVKLAKNRLLGSCDLSARIDLDLASRIWSSKLAKLCASLFVTASCWSSNFVKRLEASLHSESGNSRSGHFAVGSAISIFRRCCGLRRQRITAMED
jgi:hypothetical protein